MSLLLRADYEQRLREISLLVTDVDGVLTDGQVHYTEGEAESKSFYVRDGSAVHIAALIQVPVVVITARSSAAVNRRFSELPVHALCQGVFDKVGACLEIQRSLGIADERVAYIGDDLVDLPLLQRVGLGIAVADAHPRIQQAVGWVTKQGGGRGAFREVVDDIVSARGLWDSVLSDYHTRQGA